MVFKKFISMILVVVCTLEVLNAQRLIWSSSESGELWTSDLAGSNPRLFVDIDAASGEEGHEPRKLAYSEDTKRIYWTENSLGLAGIYSVKDDGSDVQKVVDIRAVFGSGEYFTEGLAIVGDSIFWTDTAKKKIYRAGLDGSGAAVLLDGTDGTINDATGITSDGTSLYWCDRGFEGVYKAGLDGSNPRQIVDVVAATGDNFFGTWDIVFAEGKLYWTGVFGPSVYSANPDGTGVTAVLPNAGSIGATRPFGITEHDGVIYFGDSEQFTTAIYAVGVDGQNARRLVKGTTDDRYPIVIPGSGAVSEPTSNVLSVTDVRYEADTGRVTIAIKGAALTDHEVVSSSTLDFSDGGDNARVLTGGEGSLPVILTTDSSGQASGAFTLNLSLPQNFIRIQVVD